MAKQTLFFTTVNSTLFYICHCGTSIESACKHHNTSPRAFVAGGAAHGTRQEEPVRKFLLGTVAALVVSGASQAQAACTPTGFIRDSINLTAALINPAAVTGSVNATGCNIGVYFNTGVANLNNVDVYGANYFGVVVDGNDNSVSANINNNIIHNIGEVPFNGAQHGVGLYLTAYNTAQITGKVTGNIVTGYQKGGIVANGKGVRLTQLDNNNVIGLGHVTFIAQNGIQIGYGAMPYPSEVVSNHVTANSYIGTPGDGSSAAGILVVGGAFFGTCGASADPCPYTTNLLIGLKSSLTAIGTNVAINNDVGIYAFNADASGNPPATPTSVIMLASIAGDDICYNPYQAGISDFGNTDVIAYNYIIQGGGYGPACGIGIDVTGSTNPQVAFNNVPPTSTAMTTMTLSTPGQASAAPARRPVPVQ
jgi:hypothetical protein